MGCAEGHLLPTGRSHDTFGNQWQLRRSLLLWFTFIQICFVAGFLAFARDPDRVFWLSVKNGTQQLYDPITKTNKTIPTFYKSSKKHYVDAASKYLIGSWTCFITMEKGLPKSIEWEEGCDECFKWCGKCTGLTSGTRDVVCGENREPHCHYC